MCFYQHEAPFNLNQNKYLISTTNNLFIDELNEVWLYVIPCNNIDNDSSGKLLVKTTVSDIRYEKYHRE